MSPFYNECYDALDLLGLHNSTLSQLGGEVAPNVPSVGSLELHFFDSLEEPPDLFFFETFSTLHISNKDQDELDFLDCFPRPTESILLTDWMDLSLFYDETSTVHCVWEDATSSQQSNLPSPKACLSLERGGIPHSFDDCPTTSSFSIIIDSGASLSISPCVSDFVGVIKDVKLKLGGMANGMAITGKGEVEWTSRLEEGRM